MKNDVIYRQAAIDELKRISFSHWFECGEYLSEDTREIEIINSSKALEVIEALPPAQPEQRWIPCGERLPIGSDVVLLSLPPSIDANGDELVGGVICGHYIGGKSELWGISDGSTFGYGLVSIRYGTNPTHWMPMPEPYREDGKK